MVLLALFGINGIMSIVIFITSPTPFV